MSTVQIEAVTAAPSVSIVRRAVGRARYALAGLLAVVTVAVAPGVAYAAPPVQPGTAEVEAGFASMQAFLTGVAIPALIGIAVIGIVVMVGLKYLRKGARSA